MRKLYYLLFYKLYKIGSISRQKSDASLGAGLLIGFILVAWFIHFLALINLYNDTPGILFILALLISIPLNVMFVLRKNKYEQIINEMESKKPPIFYHIIVYLLFAWTFVGILFY